MPTWKDQGFTEVRTEEYDKKYGVLGSNKTVTIKKKLRTYENPHTGETRRLNYPVDMKNAVAEKKVCAKNGSFSYTKDGKKYPISDKKRAHSRGWLNRMASDGYMYKMSHEKWNSTSNGNSVVKTNDNFVKRKNNSFKKTVTTPDWYSDYDKNFKSSVNKKYSTVSDKELKDIVADLFK